MPVGNLEGQPPDWWPCEGKFVGSTKVDSKGQRFSPIAWRLTSCSMGLGIQSSSKMIFIINASILNKHWSTSSTSSENIKKPSLVTEWAHHIARIPSCYANTFEQNYFETTSIHTNPSDQFSAMNSNNQNNPQTKALVEHTGDSSNHDRTSTSSQDLAPMARWLEGKEEQPWNGIAAYKVDIKWTEGATIVSTGTIKAENGSVDEETE